MPPIIQTVTLLRGAGVTLWTFCRAANVADYFFHHPPALLQPQGAPSETGMPEVVQINPSLLTWARKTAGLSLEEAADKLGLKDTRKLSAADKLRGMEDATLPITEALLAKAASVYRRP